MLGAFFGPKNMSENNCATCEGMDCDHCRDYSHWEPIQYPVTPPAPSQSALQVQQGGDHYKKLKIQPIEYIHANGIPFAEGNVIKYVTRWRDKGGIKDLEKAKHFIELLIELETRQP